ncbi:MAG: hypothetical protein JXO22_06275 [Phycisphaerae bacterium]|nr:hypothetical protein [Phycisphaerae bacterium]
MLADCDGDGTVNVFDIDTFIAAIIGNYPPSLPTLWMQPVTNSPPPNVL